jgi:hypothetical protein
MTTANESPDGPQRRLFVVGAIAAIFLVARALYSWSHGVDSGSLSIGTGFTDVRSVGASYLSGPNTP